jgi:hypothetical protein
MRSEPRPARDPAARDDEISALLSGIVDGTIDDDDALLRELRTDLRFQAELVQYRKLLRALRSMRSEVVDPGPALVDEVLTILDEHAERHGLRDVITPRRAVYVGGIAAATAAGLGTAFVLARRRAA